MNGKKLKMVKLIFVQVLDLQFFAPFENLGLIIIDEEHENSYKQTESPRYDTKDIAKKRGIYNKCTVLYASATPTIDFILFF